MAARRQMRRSAAVLGLMSLPDLRACFDLDPCTSKPNFDASKCERGSTVACWSLDPTTPWACWSRDWVPAWVLHAGPASGDAFCLSHRTPLGLGSPYYEGTCTLEAPSAVGEPAPLRAQRPWAEARRRARATVAEMNETEKEMLMYGVGWKPKGSWFDLEKWWYVGGTAPIPRLGIPSLNMQDAAGGFRPYWSELVGTVTSWPSLLSLAATWDPASVRAFAVALGEEFAGKGANTVLGPSVNVHRVARNGRNFEYLSGEDPYLGAKLAPAYVEGVQSQGLMAVLKHWVFNEQETKRDREDSVVDPKTAWELYYPPFQAAVDAGVDAVMCSYNRVNGVPACSSKEQLEDVLRKTMGFQGFVQSDWWAAHGTTISEGLDQDMPGADKHFHPKAIAAADPEAVNEAVERILSAMYRAELPRTTVCSPPLCKNWLERNVTGRRHAALARSLAAESIVLLKNEEALLPLQTKPGMTIAVVGAAAVAKPYDPAGEGQGGADAWHTGDYYSGGGSGHVAAGYVVTPLEGIRARAAAAGAMVVASPSNDEDEARTAAMAADVVVVVAATTCGESVDRANLTLDGRADELIAAMAEGSRRLVVLLQVPGAVVMPWRHDVQAILALFLGGQETGSAWASVLFGDHAPTGRLPLTMPATEADTIAPGEGERVVYQEGLATSYRNTSLIAAFPFGHGLTYTTFEYLSANSSTCFESLEDLCVTVLVQNVGQAAGRTIAQLYLELSPEAGQPAPILKGFQKTPSLLPETVARVVFRLTPQDLSYYDLASKTWKRSAGATAHVGESSADCRLSAKLEVPGPASPPQRSQWGLPQHGLAIAGGLVVGVGTLAAIARAQLAPGRFGLLRKETDEEADSASDSRET